jgi:branched-chain amino acid transport system permease protein
MAQQLVNGVALGLIYAFVALGYTLVFGLLKLLNFAHGEIFMLGGMLALWLFVDWHMPVWAATVAVAGMTGLVGLVLWATCFLPVRRPEDHMAPALSSFAFGLAITAIVVKVAGFEPRTLPFDIGRPRHDLGAVRVSDAHLLVLAATAVLFAGTLLVVHHTRFGRALRALAERPRTAALMGIPAAPVIAATFFASSALAGVAGTLAVLQLGLASPLLGIGIGLKAVAVMVVGGVGNIPGALVAGLLLGLAEVALVELAAGSYADALVWGGLMLVLLLRPAGILGRRWAL